MVRRYGLVGCRLAAVAIASALMLAGASGAVAVADPGAESAGRNDGNHRADDGNHRADSGSVGSETGDHSASTTRGSGGKGNGRGGRPGDDQTSNGGRQPRSGQSGGRKPAGAESGAGTRPGDARTPTRLPAPPAGRAASRRSPTRLPAPPPTDLPPVDPGVPVEAEVWDATMEAATAAVPGEAARVSPGSVISVPASPPASAPDSLGPSVAPRGIARPPESSPPWGPGLAPPIREPSAPELSPLAAARKCRQYRPRTTALSERLQRVTAQPRASRDGGGRAAGRRRHVHHDRQRPLHWILAGEGGLCGANPRCHPLPEMKPLNNGPESSRLAAPRFLPYAFYPTCDLRYRAEATPQSIE